MRLMAVSDSALDTRGGAAPGPPSQSALMRHSPELAAWRRKGVRDCCTKNDTSSMIRRALLYAMAHTNEAGRLSLAGGAALFGVVAAGAPSLSSSLVLSKVTTRCLARVRGAETGPLSAISQSSPSTCIGSGLESKLIQATLVVRLNCRACPSCNPCFSSAHAAAQRLPFDIRQRRRTVQSRSPSSLSESMVTGAAFLVARCAVAAARFFWLAGEAPPALHALTSALNRCDGRMHATCRKSQGA